VRFLISNNSDPGLNSKFASSESRALYEQATIKFDQRLYADALPIYLKAVEISPENPFLLSKISRCYHYIDNRFECKKYADRAIAIDPNNQYEAWNSLGNDYFSKMNYQDARHMYEKSININPNFKFGWYNIGLCYLCLGQLDNAEKYYRKSTEVAPDFENGWSGIADTFKKRKNYKMAEKYYLKALSINSETAYLWISYGELFHLQKLNADAERCYFRAADCEIILKYERFYLCNYFRSNPLYSPIFYNHTEDEILLSIQNGHFFYFRITEAIKNNRSIPQLLHQFPWYAKYFDALWKFCEQNPSQQSILLKTELIRQSLISIGEQKLWL
jgi:tetratricopeptide (TPR) repeat protein